MGGWISVFERYPTKAGRYLVGWYSKSGWWNEYFQDYSNITGTFASKRVTHWQPTPGPPEAKT